MTTTKALPEPKSLVEAIFYFSDPDRSFEFVKQLRWPSGDPACPRCGGMNPYFLASRKIWKCRECYKQFSLKVGTIFEDSPIGWDKWLPAVWLLANSKNSVSSHELGRALGVTQKTAWFMFHRIRLAMKSGSFTTRMSGTVEVDETFVGGKAENMHANKRGMAIRNKTMVQGARSRDDKTVRAAVVVPPNKWEMETNVRFWVHDGSTLYTDETAMYYGIERFGFSRKTVTHGAGQYVVGDVHTNGIESFWSLLKRAIKGTQVHVSREHLQRYVIERVFAYNFREIGDLGRMHMAMAGVAGRRVTYAALIAAGPSRRLD